MIKVGLTGGIGSGKTTVSSIFQELGVPVFNSDKCARDAEAEPNIQEGFKRVLGDDIFVDGVLDRVKMRGIVFTDKDKLKQINNLVVPYIKTKFEGFCAEKEKDFPIVALESAILFENNATDGFDYIVTVTATENTRIKRVLSRDGLSVEDVMKKMANQLPEMVKVEKSDFIVINDGHDLADGITMLTKQVDAIRKAIIYDIYTKTFDLLNEEVKKIHE
jgi:dephospho-CoA kinase